MENEKEQLATPLPEGRRANLTSDRRRGDTAPAETKMQDASPPAATRIGNFAGVRKAERREGGALRPLAAQAGGAREFPQARSAGKGRFSPARHGGLDPGPAAGSGWVRASLETARSGHPGVLLPGNGIDPPAVVRRSGTGGSGGDRDIPASCLIPHYHQAVETVEDADRRDQEIVEELQRGYKLKHRLLRPAIVKVAVKPKAQVRLGRNGERRECVRLRDVRG